MAGQQSRRGLARNGHPKNISGRRSACGVASSGWVWIFQSCGRQRPGLLPEGLETAITVEQMANLIVFLLCHNSLVQMKAVPDAP
jgi:hypothetical protein